MSVFSCIDIWSSVKFIFSVLLIKSKSLKKPENLCKHYNVYFSEMRDYGSCRWTALWSADVSWKESGGLQRNLLTSTWKHKSAGLSLKPSHQQLTDAEKHPHYQYPGKSPSLYSLEPISAKSCFNNHQKSTLWLY